MSINQYFKNLISLAGVGLQHKFYIKYMSVPLPVPRPKVMNELPSINGVTSLNVDEYIW